MTIATVTFYNPQKPSWGERVAEFQEFDAQVNATTAFTFNAASFDDALVIAQNYGAYQLTQFARPCRVIRESWINRHPNKATGQAA